MWVMSGVRITRVRSSRGRSLDMSIQEGRLDIIYSW